VAAPDPLDRPARRKETATAQLALAAALRGDQGYDGLLAGLDRVTAGEPAGILGVLMQDTRSVGAGMPRRAGRATRGRIAPLRADDPTNR
jgi:hypothetical protein